MCDQYMKGLLNSVGPKGHIWVWGHGMGRPAADPWSRGVPSQHVRIRALATAAASWHQVPARVIVWPKQEAARGEVQPRLSEPLKNGPRETWRRAGGHGLCCSCTHPRAG